VPRRVGGAFADRIVTVLCELLTALGYEQVVEAWNKINKWYA
jgi:hypothetical protein